VSGGTVDAVISTKDGVNFASLPTLPAAVTHHCMVIIDDQTLFVGGGLLESGPSDKAYLLTG
jgi:hypothetical protein